MVGFDQREDTNPCVKNSRTGYFERVCSSSTGNVCIVQPVSQEDTRIIQYCSYAGIYKNGCGQYNSRNNGRGSEVTVVQKTIVTRQKLFGNLDQDCHQQLLTVWDKGHQQATSLVQPVGYLHHHPVVSCVFMSSGFPYDRP